MYYEKETMRRLHRPTNTKTPSSRPSPLPLPLGRGVVTMKPRRGDITKDRVGTLSERHPTTPKR